MTDESERELAEALFRTLYDAGVAFESNTLIPRLTATIRALGYVPAEAPECICYGAGIHFNCRAHDASAGEGI